MPAYVDKITVGKQNDRRIKLSEEDKKTIRYQYENENISIHQLSKNWNVCKRTIQFILFPERLKHSIELRHQRGGSKIYYDKEHHTKAMKEHRAYKKELLEKGQYENQPMTIQVLPDSLIINGIKCTSYAMANKMIKKFPFKDNKPSGKKVKLKCLENGKIYFSGHEAEKDLGLVKDTVLRIASKYNKNGERKSVKGYHFERIYDEN